jgi:CelD/BcsL family acetyltransferase involved in cellulose biosynthesis
MSEYRISIIYTMKELEQLREPWDQLLEKSASNSFFLTWGWIYAWAKCYLKKSRKLFIIVVYAKNEIVGIAPWYVEYVSFIGSTRKQINFLGAPESGSDYPDVFMKKGKEKEISYSIYEYILKEVPEDWDCMTLTDIPASSHFLMHLINRIDHEGKYIELTRGSCCPVTILPKNPDDYFSSLSKNRREQYRRHLKLLSSAGQVSHESYNAANTEMFDVFFNLYKKNWGKECVRLQPFIRAYAANMQERGNIQIDLLKFNGIYMAGLLHFQHFDSLLMYLMAIDKDFNPKISIGNVLIGLCIKEAINRGLSIYDFLKGEEHYKLHWANHINVSNNVYLYQKKIIPLALAFNRQIKNAGKLLLR